MTLERPDSPKFDLSQLLSGFGGIYLVNAVIAFIFAASAPIAIILTAGEKGGLAEADLASWIFGSFFINGLISIAFCLYYRQPLVFFWTIPGTVLVGQGLEHLSFAETIGAYYATGLLMLVLGLTGWMRKCMSLLPMPIVMAMVAGVFLQFGLNLIFAIRDGFLIAAPMTAAFLLLWAVPRFGRVLPPLIGALIVGIAAIFLFGTFDLGSAAAFSFARPNLYVPEFSWNAMVELVIPLAITVLAAQNAQGYAVLEAAGHKPPVNAVTAACGLGSMIAALVGTVSTCLTGPVNAIISSAGEKDRHYAAGVLVALFALVFGLFSPVFTRFMLATPAAFIAALAGLALVRILERAFVTSFSGSFTLGAVVTFLVTVADVPILSIGAPFWGLVVGFAVSWALERDDFRNLTAERA
ncbi:MAG: benzoate/H(+) symporter BenE family transporter [Hyphomicrobiales bacterium]|nr:benzoate/H(+) symporter BenE family transporter [Hyphomicrobiales bacterium]